MKALDHKTFRLFSKPEPFLIVVKLVATKDGDRFLQNFTLSIFWALAFMPHVGIWILRKKFTSSNISQTVYTFSLSLNFLSQISKKLSLVTVSFFMNIQEKNKLTAISGRRPKLVNSRNESAPLRGWVSEVACFFKYGRLVFILT